MSQQVAIIGQRIQSTLLRWTGLPVCVGIGPTKSLAKLANHLAKQDPVSPGVCDLEILPAAEIARLLAPIPVAEVWGVGGRLAQRLALDQINRRFDRGSCSSGAKGGRMD
ncbi:Y-family DNA polymerase [Halochromatium sp.]